MQYRGYERIRDSVRRTDGSLAVAVHIPRKPKARLKKFQVTIATGRAWKTGIARIVKTSRCIWKDRALHTLFEPVVVEVEHRTAVVGFGEVWFPPKPVCRGQSRRDFPGVLQIEAEVVPVHE